MTKNQSLHGTTVAKMFSNGLGNLGRIEAIDAPVVLKKGSARADCSKTTTANFTLVDREMDGREGRKFGAFEHCGLTGSTTIAAPIAATPTDRQFLSRI